MLRSALGGDANPLASLRVGNSTTGRALRNRYLSAELQDEQFGVRALDVGSLGYLETTIRRLRPKVILQIGSGLSTACLTRYMVELHGAKDTVYVYSIEPTGQSADLTTRRLAWLGLAANARVLRLPLRQQTVDGEPTTGFDLQSDALRQLLGNVKPDFVVVDGPSGEGELRFGTIPLVRDFLESGASIFIDDALRDSELKTAATWSERRLVDVLGVCLVGKGLLVGKLAA